MVNPKTRFRFQTSTIVCLICVFHQRQGSGRTIHRIWGKTPPRKLCPGRLPRIEPGKRWQPIPQALILFALTR
jgi:hypothetical protein